MLALLRNGEFAGIVGTETKTSVNGVTVCIGDIVKVEEGKSYNECEGVVGVFGNKISVMGLGSIPLSELNVAEVVKSHDDLEAFSILERGYFEVLEFKM